MATASGWLIAVSLAAVAALVPGAAGAGPLDHPGSAKALACSACHGFAGNSRSSSMPILAGMDPAYFKKQIEAYAAGRRPSPEMEPYAKQVLALGVDDIARYFAAQTMEPTPVAGDSAAAARGRTAAAACVICHGDGGRGDPGRGVPRLAGQPPGYLTAQMALFKEDRRNPGDPAMAALKALLKTLPDSVLADLAAYYSGLR